MNRSRNEQAGEQPAPNATLAQLTSELGFDLGPLAATEEMRATWPDGSTVFGDGSDTLARRIDAQAEASNTDDRAVATTVLWKSYCFVACARPVGSWALARRVPDVSLDHVVIDLGEPGRAATVVPASAAMHVLASDALADQPGVGVVERPADLLDHLLTMMIESHLEPAAEAFADAGRVGRRGLRALATANIAALAARGRNQDLHRAFAEIDEVVARLPVDYSATTRVEEWHDSDRWKPLPIRTGCCLAYRLDGARYCSNCHLLSDEQRQVQLRSAGYDWRPRTIPHAAPHTNHTPEDHQL